MCYNNKIKKEALSEWFHQYWQYHEFARKKVKIEENRNLHQCLWASLWFHLLPSLYFFLFLFLSHPFSLIFRTQSNENWRNENLFSSGEIEKIRKAGKQQVLVEKQQQKTLLKVQNIRFFYSHDILVWLWLGEWDRWVLWKIIIIS